MRGRGFGASVAFGVVVAGFVAAAAAAATPPDESAIEGDFGKGVELIKAGKAAQAYQVFDAIDRKMSAAYAGGPRVYCAHNERETAVNLMHAAADGVEAVAKGWMWCDSIYYRAYTLTDLGRTDEAADVLDRLLKMGPEYPTYLNERAELLLRARRLDEALMMFRQAEDRNHYMTSDEAQASARSRSCRGIGYVLTEMGRLDESESTYRRCLVLDPKDEKSASELTYIAQQRAKKK